MEKIYKALLAGILAGPALAAVAQTTTPQYAGLTGAVTGISPNGKFVVGTKGNYSPDNLSSYVYDVETKETTWGTDGSDADTDKGGKFAKITDQGIIAGSMTDKNLTVDLPGDDWTPPSTINLTTAAVWSNGKVYKLGIGGNDKNVFTDPTDGSYASGISEDGSIVSGYLQYSYFPQIAMGWRYDAATDSYTDFRYALPSGVEISSTTGLSSDGKVAIGTVFCNGANHAIVWTSENDYKILDLGVDDFTGLRGNAAAISPDGRYVLVTVLGGESPKVGVYDVASDKTETVEISNAFEAKGFAIDNNGNFFCSVQDKTTYQDNTFFYYAADKTLLDMDYYMANFAKGMSGAPSMTKATVVGISGDGSKLVGYSMDEYYATSSWWMSVNTSAVTVSPATGVKLFTSGIDKVTAKWDGIKELPEGVTVKQYDLYLDGKNVHKATVEDGQAGGQFRYEAAAQAGKHEVFVIATCAKDGKEFSSPKSEEATTVVPSTYAIPMTDDFESQSFDKNTWEKELLEGNSSEVQSWLVAGGDFENNTYFASTTSIMLKPYSSVLYSRFFDATDLKDVYVTFYNKFAYVNDVSPNQNEELFDLEYSTDGENWTLLKSLCAADMTAGAWNFSTSDFSKELAGKLFKLRFNAHGKGYATLKWYLDYVTVGKELDPAKPEGVKAVANNGKNEIEWKNSLGTYEASYVVNSNVLTDYNIGNEGKPLVVAVSFPAEKLTSRVGQYISGVASFIYDDQTIGSTKATQAEAIIYEDGVEVARQAFANTAFDEPYSQAVALSKPVKIEAGKEYKVAVRIHDYDPQQTPLYFQADQSGLIPGVTDLYSEDEGKTWQKISEFNASHDDMARSWCIWPIRALISEDATPLASDMKFDEKLIAYNVYRNGEQINTKPVYSSFLKFTDENTDKQAEYTVQAFYTDGRVSVLSDPTTPVTTSIDGVVTAGGAKFSIDKAEGTIALDGQYDAARLAGIDGRTVATAHAGKIQTTALTPGIYVLSIENGGKASTYKIVVR